MFKAIILSIALFLFAGCSSGQAVKAPAGPTPEQMKIDSLQTINVTLNQKVVKFEQDNNTLNARLSDVEAKLKAELDRAAAAAKPPPPPPGRHSPSVSDPGFRARQSSDGRVPASGRR